MAGLALVLNVLSPVIGYARASGAQGSLSVELCHAAGAQDVVIAISAVRTTTRRSRISLFPIVSTVLALQRTSR